MQTHWHKAATCCVIRVKVGEKVVLALGVLEVEAVHHEVCAMDPLDVLNLLCHFAVETKSTA